jgi:broad specificity phosphatase PhoE
MAWSSSSPTTYLTLVRHGQASYLEGDTYDRLSAIGEMQSRTLGDYWVERNISFDYVYRGPAERHRRTEEIVAERMRLADAPWPKAVDIPEFDEFQGEEVVLKLGPILADRHDHIRKLVDDFEAAPDKDAQKRTLDLLFHEVAYRWANGEVDSPEVESWQAFTERVGRALQQIRDTVPDGKRVVVFSSGGPTAVVTSLVLGMPPLETLDLSFSPRNASYSEYHLQDGSIYLSSFNSFPHLADRAELLTYR